MLFNYLIIAIRNIRRSKLYSAINILGLSTSVACCLLLSLYIKDEVSFDAHHSRLDDLYRISTHISTPDGIRNMRTVSPPIAPALAAEVPEIEFAVRAVNPPGVAQNLIRYGDNVFYESDGFIVDESFFQIFSYEFLEGNAITAVSEPNTIVITDRMAMKLFGDRQAVGNVISVSQGGPVADFRVTAVVKENLRTHLPANFFVPITSSGWAEYLRAPDAMNSWAGNNFVPSYVKLVPGHDKDAVIRKMNEVLQKHGAADLKARGVKKTIGLEPLGDIYLRSDIGQSPRIIYIYIIGSIGAFILLIACINFMNLSTARASQRAGEIGVRKVMGAMRSTLAAQLLGEAMVIIVISIGVSLVLAWVAIPWFNSITGKNITLQSIDTYYLAGMLVALTLITGIFAGSYPAFYLSSLQPARVLKGKFDQGKNSWLRRGLIVFQFMIAIVLVCGVITIGKQLRFMQEKNLGFDAASRIVVPLRTSEAQLALQSLRQELLKHSDITDVASTSYVPGGQVYSDFRIYPKGGSVETATIVKINRVDYGYMELLDIPLIAGTTFPVTDKRTLETQLRIIINRTGARMLGYEPENIIGESVFSFNGTETIAYEIIGVTEDYHQTTLKEEIVPTVLMIPEWTEYYDYMVVKTAGIQFGETLSLLDSTWKSLVGDTPFEFTFLDETIQRQYDQDRRVAGIINSFAIASMVICCLGLYGLSTYMAEKRIREIGIRKVMGASVGQIVAMMSSEFVKLVVVAIAISTPLAWYLTGRWLETFAYRAEVGPMVFLAAGLIAILVALVTVAYESYRAAMSDPVKALKNE